MKICFNLADVYNLHDVRQVFTEHNDVNRNIIYTLFVLYAKVAIEALASPVNEGDGFITYTAPQPEPIINAVTSACPTFEPHPVGYYVADYLSNGLRIEHVRNILETAATVTGYGIRQFYDAMRVCVLFEKDDPPLIIVSFGE